MKVIALYLDKLNEHMERMLMERCSEEIDVRFVSPTIGRKGELKDADIFIDTTFKVTKDIIDAAPHLKLIQRTGIGVDMVDVAYANERGIPISVCRGFNSNAVAELTILDILSLYRRLTTLDSITKKGEWHTWTYRHESYEIMGKTVGVLGAGTIGCNVIKKVQTFGANVIYHNVNRFPKEKERELGITYKSFEDVISLSDILTLHLPLLPSTRNIIGVKELKAMKNTAILVDTARDSLVDLNALVDALKYGEISGAAIDILDPIAADSPFKDIDDLNLVLTPHIGAATYDNYDRVYKLCGTNALHILHGEKPEMVL